MNLEFKIAETLLRCQESPNIIIDSSFIVPVSNFPEERHFSQERNSSSLFNSFVTKQKSDLGVKVVVTVWN